MQVADFLHVNSNMYLIITCEYCILQIVDKTQKNGTDIVQVRFFKKDQLSRWHMNDVLYNQYPGDLVCKLSAPTLKFQGRRDYYLFHVRIQFVLQS